MEDETIKKNKSKKTSKTSSVKKSVKKTKTVTNLSNDELLEQILNKKKKSVKKSTTTKVPKEPSSVVKKSSTPKKTKQFNQLENDFIYEQIKTTKLKKKKLEPTNQINEKVVDSEPIHEIHNFISKEAKIVFEDKKVEVRKPILERENLEEAKDKNEIKQEFEEFLTEIENDKLLRDIKAALENDTLEYIQPDYEVSNKDAIKQIDDQINERLRQKFLKEQDVINKKKQEKLVKKQNFINKLKSIKFKKIKLNKKVKSVEKTSKEVESDDSTTHLIKEHKEEKKLKKTNKNIFVLMFALAVVLFGIITFSIVSINRYNKEQELKRLEQEELVRAMELKALQDSEYERCLKRIYDEFDTNDEINAYVNELNIYLDNRKVAVKYEDLTYGFSYTYKDGVSFYAASTAKVIAAMYLYEKAALGEIDLNSTMKYYSKYRMGSSAKMKNRSYGEYITLRDLVRYSITVSDNTAHNMLVKYIGVNSLREYGLSLGANLSHLGNDSFGYIDVSDGNIYLKKLYYLFNNTGDIGTELESYFIDADQNGLKIETEGISAAHKYGEYESYYHDIGIVYSENPYAISILTREGLQTDYAQIKDINNRIYKLHNMYYENRVDYCTTSVYGK